MLNEFLYKALKAAFGSVEVENEGVHATVERVRFFGYTNQWKMSDTGEHGEQYRINCPFCKNSRGQSDRGHHLYISYLSYARPKVNGEELSAGPLVAHCFRGNCVASSANRALLEERIHMGMVCVDNGMQISATVDMPDNQAEESRYSTNATISLDGIRTWVPSFQWCAEGMPDDISSYLHGRGLNDATIAHFGLGWGQLRTPRTGQLIGKGYPFVVIPVTMNGQLVGVQARCPDCYTEAAGLRYWIHPGMRKRTVVYNLDSARKLGLGVVVEGVFDVFKVGTPGVCCFGHTLSTVQRQLLNTIEKGLILLPDTDKHDTFDTVAEAHEQALQWNADNVFPLGVHVVVLPAKDAGALSSQQVWLEIVKQVKGEMQEYIINQILNKL